MEITTSNLELIKESYAMRARTTKNATLMYLIVACFAAFTGYEFAQLTQAPQEIIAPNIDKTKPILTVAGIVFVEPENKFALIQRGKAPKGLAMFGGHVEAKESPKTAFIREAKEELNVDVENLKLIGLNGNYGRDPRQHSVEGTYSCSTKQIPHAGSDAKSVSLHTAVEILELVNNTPSAFAFDHGQILKKFFENNTALQQK